MLATASFDHTPLHQTKWLSSTPGHKDPCLGVEGNQLQSYYPLSNHFSPRPGEQPSRRIDESCRNHFLLSNYEQSYREQCYGQTPLTITVGSGTSEAFHLSESGNSHTFPGLDLCESVNPRPCAGSNQFISDGLCTIQHLKPRFRRKAVFVGINYFNRCGQLHGCISDTRNMAAYLIGHFGYSRSNIVILTDDQYNPKSIPTKQNILLAMHWLVKDAQPHDSLFFFYSGHGGRELYMDGDDSYDEVIYPVDFRENGHIDQDEIYRVMVRPLAQVVQLTTIFDSRWKQDFATRQTKAKQDQS